MCLYSTAAFDPLLVNVFSVVTDCMHHTRVRRCWFACPPCVTFCSVVLPSMCVRILRYK